ncbi:multicopper oxidase family protein [Pseudogracilibacillus auburnensis]|uniref:FtsP/CotA-like multicopper oxidase with cupredoxin domain n=1 Tax=Pseudogracilibacillus auburnensis TaxID=1494959 RepID=A0A2V3W1G4_9BACI|nr:multicopper oxidase domain-containing protein [Pseudogracilibacillus auburnensis]MBO1002927.1 multicopper oxidase domain-containing protein [Pseudogracilibacillus auburnensis]PXW87024.1 FtsP/CotA-like multicopper oxidase with cupredoxin domain [Pseudogracilibacillus auburnensis]
MKRYMFMILSLAFIIILGACSTNFGNMRPFDMKNFPEDRSRGPMMMGHGHHNMPLQQSTGENELRIPPILESDKEIGNEVYYTIEAQKGQTEIFEGIQTKTLGYNSSFLGPVMKLKKGQNVHIKLKNSLDEETTFHWHGLIIDGEADGGPHDVIQPGEEKEINFKVQQDRATLWFHPHPKGKTAKQVFEGLAGLIYIEDSKDDPFEYGENDFPLILQDRTFNNQKQLDYQFVQHPDGTMGESLLINGTLSPRLTVNNEKVRFRLLNGSNMRNYTIKLSNNQSFQQIASDGGLLNAPVELKELQLTPSERAEIVIDFSKFKKDEDIKLIMDDGTVLLPFQIKDKGKEVKNEIQEPLTPVTISNEEMQKQVSKEIVLFGMGHHVTINGKKFDMNRIDFTQKKGETEVWEIYNKPDMMGGMIHPFHIHGTQFKVISINGEEPPENLQGYKDTIALDPGDRAKIAVKFEEKGVFMYHCHILEHEDNGMMGQIKVE